VWRHFNSLMNTTLRLTKEISVLRDSRRDGGGAGWAGPL
jgi:hypothetical protein